MSWKIKEFVFHEQQQTLTNEQNTLKIEPMMCELLAYFCQHQNQIISKEQLLEAVWHGRYVSDNTVSKLITKLRKVLQDNARNPEFIVTVPKRGYQFVADAKPIQEQSNPHTKSGTSTVPPLYYKVCLLALALLTIVTLVWFALSNHASPKVIVSAKAVTSDKGSEYFPSFAADGERLSYMNHDGERFKLYVKNIFSGEQVEVTHGVGEGVGPGNWNDTGTKLVYLVATKESCQYFIRDFNGLVMSEPTLIYTCNPGSYGAIKFTHIDNLLIFSESPEVGKPYSLYSLDLESNKTQWLPQPDIHIGGNNQFDVHPTQNKLLISSPDEQQWEGFYQLDLDTQRLRSLFKLNAYICCGIWSHDGEHVVLMGEHPAREIIQYDLDGSNETVIFAGPQQLHRPERHSNGIDYAFSVANYDLNVNEYVISAHQTQPILNDTFDERLAVLSPAANRVAYISLTSGNEELWLYDRDTSNKKKVTQFADGRHYLDLAWSPDEMKVAALTLNGIHIIDLNTGEADVLTLPEKEFRGMSFKSPHHVAFSMKLGSVWQVVEFNLNDNSMVRLDPQWKSIQYDTLPENWLWVDQNNKWFQGENPTPLKLAKQNLSVFYGRQFNVKKSGEYIAVFDRHQEQLQIYKNGSDKPFTSLNSQIGHFSIKGDIVLISQKSSETNDSDIYQTFSVSAK
ncbi:winged helix-turn-helix domain-containing protein [uncultured Paraglaciecola sp.]|uniref:winged helix-turn-helix domain-containing protein n=1 Tax=uncultured Paraglaciecola sp. TaxID=1765024 RepID=UPI0026135A4C|nr:winged helix-turn-helix domain-containing protein [uncultured Paraglaciecola sp.]